MGQVICMFLVGLFLNISMLDVVFRRIRFWWCIFFFLCVCVFRSSFLAIV